MVSQLQQTHQTHQPKSGVSWHPGDKKWVARIREAGERRGLGYFCGDEQGEIAAAIAYDEASRNRKTKPKRKELNFPCEDDGEDEDEDQDEDERKDIPVERRVSKYRLVGN